MLLGTGTYEQYSGSWTKNIMHLQASEGAFCLLLIEVRKSYKLSDQSNLRTFLTKKEKKMKSQEDQIIIIDIHLTRGLFFVLITILLASAVIGYFTLNQQSAFASDNQANQESVSSTSLRQYYLTPDHTYDGSEALTACAAGYHMASLWELMDVSNLEYDTLNGESRSDSGQGPPAIDVGWVRTGYNSNNSNTWGNANCNSWKTIEGFGTLAGLQTDWTDSSTQDIHIWDIAGGDCNVGAKVWCIED